MMKTRSLRLLVTMSAVCAASRLSADEVDAADFPYAITVELGTVKFAPGDHIEIASLRGDRPHLEVGGRYLIEGTYTLVSAEEAMLGWMITSQSSPNQRIGPQETTHVMRGSGSFRLIKNVAAEGWSHVSFYVRSSATGGVYFGEAGIEKSILRRPSWSEAPTVATRSTIQPPGPKPAGESNPNHANAALLAFLGSPVPPPSTPDPAYTPEGLTAAFMAFCRDSRFDVQNVAIDVSEFPFLVYGVIAQPKALREVKPALAKTLNYSYNGAVSGNTTRGGTFFALNIIPSKRYPPGQTEAINRRLMLRLQMLASRVEQEPR